MPRLILYYNYIGKLDLIDKKNKLTQNNFKLAGLKVLQIQSKFSSKYLNLSKIYLIFGFLLSLLGNQRFFMKNLKNKFIQTYTFAITLRKTRLFYFLDICLGSLFFIKSRSMQSINTALQPKLYFFTFLKIVNVLNTISYISSYRIILDSNFKVNKKMQSFNLFSFEN